MVKFFESLLKLSNVGTRALTLERPEWNIRNRKNSDLNSRRLAEFLKVLILARPKFKKANSLKPISIGLPFPGKLSLK